MPYDPTQNQAIWANQNLFGYAPQPATATTTTGAATPSASFAVPGGPEFKTPTAAEIAANQNTYSQSALGAYQGLPVIQQQLTGQLPRDVQANINQMGAERGIATGMPGSAATNAATMKALGLTSMGLQQQGLENLNAAYHTFPQLNPLGISGENLAAWRTATDYQTGALHANAQAALQNELQAIRNNTALTMQQREYAMQQAKNRAYAAALQPFMDQYGTSTSSSPYVGGPGSREANQAAGQAMMDEQDWMWNEGGLGLPAYTGGMAGAGTNPEDALMYYDNQIPLDFATLNPWEGY